MVNNINTMNNHLCYAFLSNKLNVCLLNFKHQNVMLLIVADIKRKADSILAFNPTAHFTSQLYIQVKGAFAVGTTDKICWRSLSSKIPVDMNRGILLKLYVT
jgi:hypothetical protein